MKITKENLIAWQASSEYVDFFNKQFTSGEAEHQDVLNALAEENEVAFAKWLISKVGKNYDAIELDEIIGNKSFFFAGSIKVRKNIKIEGFLIAGGSIKAGCGIEAGDGIKAGLGIKAGEGIKAGDGIEAGWGIKAGWGIEAGDGIKAGLGIEAGCGIEAGEGIKAGWVIKAGWGIKAGWVIKAGEGIKAGDGIEAGWGIKAGWGIEAGDGIKAGDGIEAGWGIEAGCGIEAGEGIKAGWGIEAGWVIKAGVEFGIFAGLKIKIPENKCKSKMLNESDYEYLDFQEINNKRLELMAVRLREEMPQLFDLIADEYGLIGLTSIACEIDETFPKLSAILERETESQLESWCEKENEYQKSNTYADDPANYLKRDARR